MPATKPAFLYFDLGNVLLSFSHERMCRQMAEAAGVSADLVRQALFEPAGPTNVQWRFERGDLNALSVYEHFCETLGVQPDRETLAAAGADIFAEIAPMVALVEELAARGQRLGILSNTNPTDWEFVSSGRFPFLNRCFEVYLLSYQVRRMKPEREIYVIAAQRSGVPMSEVFFVDDRRENFEGALAAGLDAVLFTGADDLRVELQSRGVL